MIDAVDKEMTKIINNINDLQKEKDYIDPNIIRLYQTQLDTINNENDARSLELVDFYNYTFNRITNIKIY